MVGVVLREGALPLEVRYRLPSVAAAVLAVGVLAAWLARHATRGVVVASVGVLLLMPSFSLYGQAARPYAVALAVAVLATVAWSRLVASTFSGASTLLARIAVVCIARGSEGRGSPRPTRRR